MYFLVEKLRHLVGVYGTSQFIRCGLYHSVFTNVHQLLVEIGTDTWLERISSWQNTTTTWLKVCDYLTLKTLSTKQHTILKNILGRSTTTKKKKTTQFSGQTKHFYSKFLTEQEVSEHTPWMTSFLILLLIVSSSSSTLALLGVLSLDTAWASTTVWRPQGEVDVLLTVQANHKGGDVHHLLAHTAKTDNEGDFRKHFKSPFHILHLYFPPW